MLDQLKLTLVESLADVEEMMTWLGERREFLAVDVETEGLNVGCDRIRLAQFGDATRGYALDYKDWRGVVAEVVGKYDRAMVAHNLLFDSKMLKWDGIEIPQRLAHDSMVMTHLNNSAARMDLKGAAAHYVDKRAGMGQQLLGQAMALGGWSWATIPTHVPAYWTYSALDTCLSAMLAEKLWPRISSEFREAYELELAVIHCLRDAEIAGLLVDEEYRRACAWKLQQEIDVVNGQIAQSGVPAGFNPGSDKQVRDYLLGQGAPLFLRTDAGNLSVDKHVLKWLGGQGYGIAGLIGQYRTRTKMLDSYARKFGEIHTQGYNAKGSVGLAVDGVIRASTRPVEARTGRMSVTDPPLQTLPRGRVIRDCIVPREGHAIVLADFSGMEMRALASLAQEENMLAAYARGEDLHNFAAMQLYGEGFTKPQRTLCKNGGFALVYGAGVEKFSVTAGIDVGTGQQFMDMYHGLFPGIRPFMEETSREVYERAGGRKGMGYVQLWDGRQLPVEAEEAYKGVNYKIQGGCAISMKRKIVELDAAGLGPYFRLPVHDELFYEVPIDLARQARQVIESVMPDRHNWPGVTLEIESDIVPRWGYHYRDDFPAYIDTAVPEWMAEVAA